MAALHRSVRSSGSSYASRCACHSPRSAPAVSGLSEFQNPNTGLNFQATGKLTTPLGAKLLRSAAVPSGTIIGLDKNYALEQICGSEVVVEYDKLIDRQLERAAITSISGFAKLFTDAAKVLKV